MEGLLHKDDEVYFLEIVHGRIGKIIIASSDRDIGRLLNHHKLSLPNCESIKRGYDLDSMAKEKFPDKSTQEWIDSFSPRNREGFIEGANTILELFGGKFFSQNDMIEFMQFIVSNEELENTSSVHKSTAKHYLDEFCKSHQKTEWKVEILI